MNCFELLSEYKLTTHGLFFMMYGAFIHILLFKEAWVNKPARWAAVVAVTRLIHAIAILMILAGAVMAFSGALTILTDYP